MYTLNFHCFGMEGCLKKGLSKKKALEASESLEVRSKAPDPVVAIVAPKYLAESSRGIRGPGACGGGWRTYRASTLAVNDIGKVEEPCRVNSESNTFIEVEV